MAERVVIVASLEDELSRPLAHVRSEIKATTQAVKESGSAASTAGGQWGKTGAVIDKTGTQAHLAGGRIATAGKTGAGGIDKLNSSALASVGMVGRMKGAWMGVTATLGAAGLGVGVLVAKMREMALAAAADQRSAGTLSKTLDALGMSYADPGAEAFIKSLMLQTGIADDQLRPAYDRLIRSTRDVSLTQRDMQLALDIGTVKGRSALEIAEALGKGYDGQTTALGRMGLGLDMALVKSGDMVAITAALSRLYSGQAKAAAADYEGQMLRLGTAAGEASETIGYSLLKAGNDVAEQFGGTDGIVGQITALGDETADTVDKVGQLTSGIVTLGKAVSDFLPDWLTDNAGAAFVTMVKGPTDALANMYVEWVKMGREEVVAVDRATKTRAILKAQSIDMRDQLNPQLHATQLAWDAYAAAEEEASREATAFGFATRNLGHEARAAATGVDMLRESFDRLGGKHRTAMQAELDMLDAIAAAKAALDDPATKGVVEHKAPLNKSRTGFDLSGERGKAAQRALLGIADTAAQASQAAFADGDFAKARELVKDGRADLREMARYFGLSKAAAREYVNELLRVPPELTTRATFLVNGKPVATAAYLATVSQYRPMGDTGHSKAHGSPWSVGASLNRTMAMHAALAGPGMKVTNALIGGGGRGYGSGDHQAGRALDVIGPNPIDYISRVRGAGGFAELHGSGSAQHVHAVMGDTTRSRAGGSGRGGDINVTVPVVAVGTITPQDIDGLRAYVVDAVTQWQRELGERR